MLRERYLYQFVKSGFDPFGGTKPIFYGGEKPGKNRRSGSTLSKSKLLGLGVEGLTLEPKKFKQVVKKFINRRRKSSWER